MAHNIGRLNNKDMTERDWLFNLIFGSVTAAGVTEWLPDVLAAAGGLSLLIYNGYGIAIRRQDLKNKKRESSKID